MNHLGLSKFTGVNQIDHRTTSKTDQSLRCLPLLVPEKLLQCRKFQHLGQIHFLFQLSGGFFGVKRRTQHTLRTTETELWTMQRPHYWECHKGTLGNSGNANTLGRHPGIRFQRKISILYDCPWPQLKKTSDIFQENQKLFLPKNLGPIFKWNNYKFGWIFIPQW